MMGMTTLALTLAGVGSGVQAIGGFKAANAAKRAGEAQQRAANDEGNLADYNASVAELQAKDAIDRGIDEEQRFRSKVRGAIGAQRAGFAAGNIDVGSGSAADVQGDAAFLGELDALTIHTNAAREAWGYKVQAEDSRRRGMISREEGAAYAAAGRANATAGRIGAIGSLVSTGGSLLAQKYGFGTK